ncbi:MAG: elongation factor G [Chloroflexi bacterium]|nr:elongation factor G [Chloroflexota bacterium]MCI0785452.1 elongation factor G [Chloroflexota bacterium]MCI0877935.1 elongation factor G [Chloroflexota bacterium]
MPGIQVANIRNVALLSHSGVGKTSLSEALLFNHKATTRIGRVEDGNTVSDYEPEEIKRNSSVQTTLIACAANDYKVNFLDTPGYDDFLGEVGAALRVVEGAVILVAAPSGVDVGTERSWSMCEAQGLPRIILVNKMDRENASFARCVSDIQGTFGNHCVPFQIPIGDAQDFTGVVSVVNPPADVPASVADEVQAARERLIEAAAESDEALADKYLGGEELTGEEILSGVRAAIWRGELIPILAGSATKNIGVEECLTMVRDFLPSPVDGIRPLMANDGADVEPDSDGPLAAFVFKTTADPFVGKLSLFRVYRGGIKSNSEVWNSVREVSERIGQLYLPKGKSQDNVTEVTAGDIGAIGKLSETLTGDTLCQRDHAVTFQPVKFPVGYYTVAVSPATKADLDKMSVALSRIVEEDPSLEFSRDYDTGESLITGVGDAQIEVAMDKIRRKFGADLRVKMPRVAYKETISQVTKAEYRHKKQSGGHGQYGHVILRLEPLERTQGFEFKSEVVGGKVPREYFPSVEKGVIKAMGEGVLAGYPIVDLKAVLYDGSFHDVDSSGMSFEIAGNQALRKGVADASPILLEPIMKLTVNAPDAYTGEVMSDLNTKRARILGMTPQDGYTEIIAEVPKAEVQRYSQDLRSVSQGRGNYQLEFDHYEPVPPNLEPRVIEEAKRAREEEKV